MEEHSARSSATRRSLAVCTGPSCAAPRLGGMLWRGPLAAFVRETSEKHSALQNEPLPLYTQAGLAMSVRYAAMALATSPETRTMRTRSPPSTTSCRGIRPGREPRSPEYIAGVRSLLENRIDGVLSCFTRPEPHSATPESLALRREKPSGDRCRTPPKGGARGRPIPFQPIPLRVGIAGHRVEFLNHTTVRSRELRLDAHEPAFQPLSADAGRRCPPGLKQARATLRPGGTKFSLSIKAVGYKRSHRRSDPRA